MQGYKQGWCIMSSIFRGLMMGTSKQYWQEILFKINAVAGNNEFTWTEIQRKFPEISKSDLSRLKCSGYFIPSSLLKATSKNKTIRRWKLHPDCNYYLTPKNLVRKKVAKKK